MSFILITLGILLIIILLRLVTKRSGSNLEDELERFDDLADRFDE